MQVKGKRDVLGKNVHVWTQFAKEPKGSRGKRHWSVIKSVGFIQMDKLEEKKRGILIVQD